MEFSIRQVNVGPLHVSLVCNPAIRITRNYSVRLDRMETFVFLTFHARSWFLNVDWTY